jgi:hypothetical protein
MKKLIISTLGLTTILFSGCQKQYNCECTNPGGKYIAFSKHCTKSQAKQKCKDYYYSNYGNVPMSETFCEVK